MVFMRARARSTSLGEFLTLTHNELYTHSYYNFVSCRGSMQDVVNMCRQAHSVYMSAHALRVCSWALYSACMIITPSSTLVLALNMAIDTSECSLHGHWWLMSWLSLRSMLCKCLEVTFGEGNFICCQWVVYNPACTLHQIWPIPVHWLFQLQLLSGIYGAIKLDSAAKIIIFLLDTLGHKCLLSWVLLLLQEILVSYEMYGSLQFVWP